jgi:nitroreductase
MSKLYESLRVLCERRQSVRDFTEQPVSAEDLAKIEQIAATSPYASGRQNWEIVRLTEPAVIQSLAALVRKRVAELAANLREDFAESFTAYAQNFTLFERAPVLLLPTFRISPGLTYLLPQPDAAFIQWERDNYTKSISCVALLILLAAEALGLGGCYMTGPLIAESEISNMIQIKKGRQIGAIIPIGYPKREN